MSRQVGLGLLVLGLGVVTAVATLPYQRLGPEMVVASVDPDPATWEWAPALVGGWPLWWVQDHPGVSVWGTLAPVGEDRVRAWAFGLDAAFFAVGYGLLMWGLRRLVRARYKMA